MAQRPLSPHLAVYRPLIGSFTSILHRGMNCLLLAGTVVLALWIVSIAVGGDSFQLINGLLASWVGQLALIAWTFAGYYFICQWLRHFAWDLGYGFDLTTASRSGWAALVVALVATLVTWGYLLGRAAV